MAWWHDLKPHRLLRYVPRHTAEELDDLEARVQAAGRVREPIRLVANGRTGEQEIVDGLGRWEVAKRIGVEPPFEALGREDDVDVAAVILDYVTRRNVSAQQKVQTYLDLHEHSGAWTRERDEAQVRANAGRSERATAQPREERGHFAAKPTGVVSGETRTADRQRDRIAVATGTSPATVSRVLAKRRGATRREPSWKRLREVLRSATRSLGEAAHLAATLGAHDIAGEIQKLQEQTRLMDAGVGAEFDERRNGDYARLPTEGPSASI